MKQLSPEIRALIAAVLSLLVIIGWSVLYKPTQPPKPAQAPAAQTPAQPPTAATAPPSSGAVQAAPLALPQPHAAAKEHTIVVENGLYRVELSNRGAIVRSWQLKKYKDDARPPRVLDLVHPDAVAQTGGWPFSLALEDAQLEKQANEALFGVSPGEAKLNAPAEVRFEWSDGRLAVTNRLKFDRSYVVEVETSATLDGKPLAHSVAWRGGFGDTTVYMPAETVQVFLNAAGKLEMLPYKKLGAPQQPAERLRQAGTFDYAGIEDRYFAAVFLPRGPRPGGAGERLTLTHWKLERSEERRVGKECRSRWS